MMYSTDVFISALWQVLPLPWKPLGMFLPGVVFWLPVPQPTITVEAFDVVTVTCQGVQDYCEKSLMTESLWMCTTEHRTILLSLMEKNNIWLYRSNCTRNQSQTCKNYLKGESTLFWPKKANTHKHYSLWGDFIWLHHFVLVFMILCPPLVYCLKLWKPTILAAPALSRLFCPQHHDSAGQLCHELSHKERSL